MDLDLYHVARHMLSNLAVVAVIDPLELSLNCKPLLPDVHCSVVTTAPISCSFTVGSRVAVDAAGNMVEDSDDGYLEYSVVSIVAPGTPTAPVLRATMAVVRCDTFVIVIEFLCELLCCRCRVVCL